MDQWNLSHSSCFIC